MADVKISQLPAAASIASTDVAPVVTGGVTSKVTAQAIVNGGLSGGTANGVLYLDGSKAATSGSALTFDGTNLSLGSAQRLLVGKNTSDVNNWGIQNYGTSAYTSGIQLTYSGVGSAGMWVPTGSALAFGVDTASGTTEQMRLTSTGLGIGTSSPAYKLHVQNSAANTDMFVGQSSTVGLFTQWRYNATTANAYGEISTYAGSNHIYIQAQSGGGNTILNLTSGNVGIGTSVPTSKLHVSSGNIQLDNTYVIGWKDSGGIYRQILQYYSDNSLYIDAPNGSTIFRNGASNTEKMRLDLSGNLLVGTTTQLGRLSIYTDTGGWATNIQDTIAGTQGFIRFMYGTTAIGSITGNDTATAYNTTSDYRLKNTITPMQNALVKVAQLKPVTYKWNADDSDGQGFIAHELQTVIPEAVTGEKDAVDDEGNPVYQGIDPSKIVATLTAALQEQQAIIESLQARITTLEGK